MSTRKENANIPMSIVAAPHTWGTNTEDVLDMLPTPEDKFEVILLADCIWERFSHDGLLKSVTTSLKRSPSSRIYMVAGMHTGRSTLVQFLRRVLDAGLRIIAVPDAAQWPGCIEELDEMDDSSKILPGADHILELEVAGTLAENSLEQDIVSLPYLTGRRRPFVLSRPGIDSDEEPVQERNRWLTVSCFAWAM